MTECVTKQLTTLVDTLVATEQWDKALVATRVLLDQHATLYWKNAIFDHVRLDVDALIAENTGSSWCLLGLLYYTLTVKGYQYSPTKGYKYFCRAADMKHVYGLYRKGRILYYGVHVNQDMLVARKCIVAAAKAGCSDAFRYAGIFYMYGLSGTHDYFKAALWYIKAKKYEKNSMNLDSLLEHHRDECCPWGRWTPNPDIQPLVLFNIRKEMYLALLVCKRRKVDKNVALVVVAYVCTAH